MINKLPTHAYEFVLAVEGCELTTELEDAIFAAGCDDATLAWKNNRIELHFTRESQSHEEAIESAIADLSTISELQNLKICS